MSEEKTAGKIAQDLLDSLRDDGWIRTAADAIFVDEIGRALTEAEARGRASATHTRTGINQPETTPLIPDQVSEVFELGESKIRKTMTVFLLEPPRGEMFAAYEAWKRDYDELNLTFVNYFEPWEAACRWMVARMKP